MKKVLFVVITLSALLLMGCASTSALDTKISNRNVESDNSTSTDIQPEMVSITFHVKGHGGSILAHVEGEKFSRAADLIKVQKHKIITFTALADYDYEIDTWSIPTADSTKKTATIEAVDDADIYDVFTPKKNPLLETTNITPKTTINSTNSRVIHTGPKGGRYYINSKGKKTYIKKKKR